MSYFYLASPYSKFSGGIVAAFEEVCEQAALLVRAGVPVFSPIAHTHSIALHGHLDPYDLSIWLEADRAFMDAAKAIIVCKMDGWDQSVGVAHEIEHFRKAGKQVIMMDPGFVPAELLPDA
jgi:nucleoside 2-deoxyribosyltransferase